MLSEKRRTKAKTDSTKKKYKALDVRKKKTRAWRKKLSKFERAIRTPRQAKKDSNFRERKFALAA